MDGWVKTSVLCLSRKGFTLNLVFCPLMNLYSFRILIDYSYSIKCNHNYPLNYLWFLGMDPDFVQLLQSLGFRASMYPVRVQVEKQSHDAVFNSVSKISDSQIHHVFLHLQ